MLRLISGVGAKGPACFLLEAGGRRLMLDLGEGPPPGLSAGRRRPRSGRRAGLQPRPQGPCRRAIAVAETRQSAGLCHRDRRTRLPKGIAARPLPIGGHGDVLGIAVETGRNGHAPGGIWLRFRHRRRLPLHRRLFGGIDALRLRPAAAAATALLDCSYGDYEAPLAECWGTLAPFVERGPLLLAGAGQWPRPGDRARTHAPRRHRHFRRRRHAKGAACSLTTAPAFRCAPMPATMSNGSPQPSSRSTARAASCSPARPTARPARPRACSGIGRVRTGDPVHRLRQSDHAGGAAGQKRPRANHALERAPAALRHGRAGARDAGEDGDPGFLRPRSLPRSPRRSRRRA